MLLIEFDQKQSFHLAVTILSAFDPPSSIFSRINNDTIPHLNSVLTTSHRNSPYWPCIFPSWEFSGVHRHMPVLNSSKISRYVEIPRFPSELLLLFHVERSTGTRYENGDACHCWIRSTRRRRTIQFCCTGTLSVRGRSSHCFSSLGCPASNAGCDLQELQINHESGGESTSTESIERERVNWHHGQFQASGLTLQLHSQTERRSGLGHQIDEQQCLEKASLETHFSADSTIYKCIFFLHRQVWE